MRSVLLRLRKVSECCHSNRYGLVTGAVFWCLAWSLLSLAATPYSAEAAAGGQVVARSDVHAKQWSQSQLQSFKFKWGGRGRFHLCALQGELDTMTSISEMFMEPWTRVPLRVLACKRPEAEVFTACQHVRLMAALHIFNSHKWYSGFRNPKPGPEAVTAVFEQEETLSESRWLWAFAVGAWWSTVSSVSSVFRTWRERADWHRLQVQPDVIIDRGPVGVSLSCDHSARGPTLITEGSFVSVQKSEGAGGREQSGARRSPLSEETFCGRTHSRTRPDCRPAQNPVFLHHHRWGTKGERSKWFWWPTEVLNTNVFLSLLRK